jgi:hypothetical protein
MINSDLSIIGHDDAFACCEPIGFDNIGRPERAERSINVKWR